MKIENGQARVSIPDEAIRVATCHKCSAGLYVTPEGLKRHRETGERKALFMCIRCGARERHEIDPSV